MIYGDYFVLMRKMFLTIVIGVTFLTATCADKDDKKWIWNNNSRPEGRNSALRDADSYNRQDASARYDVYENERPLSYPVDNYNENRPQFGGPGGDLPYRPGPNPGLLPNQRPGGVYGGQNNLNTGYGQGQGNYYPDDRPSPGIITGPVASWEREGPFKQFDHCKCAAKFNCNSPGISYGHCDVGKQYCCFSTSKKNQLGGPLPSRPIHSIDNGILVGPGGPIDPIPGGNGRPNPQRYPYGIGDYQRPGRGGRPRPGQFGDQNTYSPENGILVGPGGPFDRPYRRPYDSGFSPRSSTAGKN